MTTLAELPPASRALLQTIARYPVEACYLVQTARARYILVVPGDGCPYAFRAERTVNGATLRRLHGASLIVYVGGYVPLDFAGRTWRDSGTGERVELTAAGWELLGGRAHVQGPRPDGTWGCVCGWEQDKPHAEHVAEMNARREAP